MMPRSVRILYSCLPLLLVLAAGSLLSEPLGNTGRIDGAVNDPSGAVVPNASVRLLNAQGGQVATATSAQDGSFHFNNLGLGTYHITATAQGFTNADQDITLQSHAPLAVTLQLGVAGSSTTVDVEATAQGVETDPVAHTDIGRDLIDKLPIQSSSSGLSSTVVLTTPGVTADSNGMFHPLGEHSDTALSLDGQPITDQQSKAFSNQLQMDTVQSLETVGGVPPAEYGDKNSLVLRVSSRSGLGVKKPTGSITTEYGSFGTASTAINLAQGSEKLGNFLSISGMDSGRFLDTPEFRPLHAHGNTESMFDRIDWQPRTSDSGHLNLSYTRSWFQTPNTYDQQTAGQDQRQQIKTLNIAPTWTHLFGNTALLTSNVWFRQDQVAYYPSADIFSDLPATLNQSRRLTNTGARLEFAVEHGAHNIKMGAQFTHTFLSERFGIGITDPLYNALCVDSGGVPVVPAPGDLNPASCPLVAPPVGHVGPLGVNPGFQPGLLAFDLTRGGSLFNFAGHTDIKQEALYVEDAVNLKQLTLNLGVRGDNYNGVSSGNMVQPRLGLAYNIKKTGTVLRASYGRLFETPYNENLIVSSITGPGGLADPSGAEPIRPGHRNQFNVGFQQSAWRIIIDAEYFWKFTNNAYDFDTLFNTPLAFPIQWRKSKIDGASIRVSLPSYRGVSIQTVMGTSRARFFGPETGGVLFNSELALGPFRIDHDQRFEETTNVQYQWKKDSPWIGFTWRYDSGAVAGAVPIAIDGTTPVDLTSLSADQQMQAGLFCGALKPAPGVPLTSCAPSQYGSTRISLPAPGTFNPDTNPARIAPRHVLDVSTGWDNLFQTDRYKVGAQFTVANLTNTESLYNFLSTFSGTHFLQPRTYTGQLTFRF